MYIFITLISFPVIWIVSRMYAYLLFPVRVTNSDITEGKRIENKFKVSYIFEITYKVVTCIFQELVKTEVNYI